MTTKEEKAAAAKKEAEAGEEEARKAKIELLEDQLKAGSGNVKQREEWQKELESLQADGADSSGPEAAKADRRSEPRTVKKGDEVYLRRLTNGQKVLIDAAEIVEMKPDQVATLKILAGKWRGNVEEKVKRYDAANAIGPTDLVCPSWVADLDEIA